MQIGPRDALRQTTEELPVPNEKYWRQHLARGALNEGENHVIHGTWKETSHWCYEALRLVACAELAATSSRRLPPLFGSDVNKR